MKIPIRSYKDRAVLSETPGGLRITIPARSKDSYTIMLIFGACIWALGCFVFFTNYLHHLEEAGREMPPVFLGICLLVMLGSALFIARLLSWSLAGKEQILVTGNRLQRSWENRWFSRPQTYELGRAKNFRTQNEFADWKGEDPPDPFGMPKLSQGSIVFYYNDHKQVKIAAGIDEDEARYILQLLRERGLLSDTHFAAPESW